MYTLIYPPISSNTIYIYRSPGFNQHFCGLNRHFYWSPSNVVPYGAHHPDVNDSDWVRFVMFTSDNNSSLATGKKPPSYGRCLYIHPSSCNLICMKYTWIYIYIYIYIVMYVYISLSIYHVCQRKAIVQMPLLASWALSLITLCSLVCRYFNCQIQNLVS